MNGFLWVFAMSLFLLPTYARSQDWLTTNHLIYTIQYTEENAQELDAIKELLSTFRDSFCDAAGVDETLADASQVVIELHPRNSTSVQVGYVSLVGGPFESQGKWGYRGTIRMPGPSAYDGQAMSSSGHPMNRHFFDKQLVHEVSPIYIELLARANGSQFRGPNWFIQGTEEYFAVFHSTEYWRQEGCAVYRNRLAHDPNSMDSDFGLNICDPYNDGFVVLNFLRDEFGEEAIFQLIRSKEGSFGKRLKNATNVDFNDFLARFDGWRQRTIVPVMFRRNVRLQ